ncbi:MAG: YCF48-related protein [Gemmataceae bacterium]|nr:YCF48-related protein [Gemmataceae bacterium]
MRPFLVALAVAACAARAQAADPRHFEDAALRAVQFVDAKVGWAVGDEGVVWQTIDGGDTWDRLPTGTRASLRSLHFLDPRRGWVVGREELPGDGSVGVLLYTEDGGQTWVRLLKNAVPGLNCIRFGDARTGYALGDGSEQYPTGVFKTTDGGRNWEPVKGPRCPGWLAGDFKDGSSGALAGSWSQLATVNQGQFGTARVDPLGVRSPQAILLQGGQGLAVGQGGLLLTSSTGGARWGPTELKLPREVLSAWDFHAVHQIREHIWVVGRPGSVVLHSANRGQSWQILKTRQALPLHGVYFFDEQRGWAVGELGTILATRDGGKTWATQQRGGQRAALLFVHARAEDLPVDTLAALGLEDGQLTACVRVASPDPRSDAPVRASDPQRFAAAVRRAGGAAGELLWQFPLPRHLAQEAKGKLLESWDRLHGGGAEKHLLRQLVLALRTWRPDVVVTDHPDARVTGSPASALVAEALHEACTQAADPQAFPEQIEELGLTAWRASKVYTLWDKSAQAQVVLDNNKDLPGLQTSASEFAEPAAALLADAPPALPVQRCFRLLGGEAPAGGKDLMAGAPRSEPGVARRALPQPEELPKAVVKANRDRRTLQALAERPVAGLAEPEKVLAQMVPVLKGLSDDRAAAALLAIGHSFARQGKWPLARETFLLLAERYPAHPRAVEAYQWLIRLGSSAEARRRHELGQFYSVSRSTVVGPQGKDGDGPVKPAGFRETPSGAFVGPEPGERVKPGNLPQLQHNQRRTQLRDPEEAKRWLQTTLELGKRLSAFGSLFATDPSTQFCLQAAHRQLGGFKEAQEYYAWFKTTHAGGPWREVAAAELWLASPQGQPPRPVGVCRQTTEKPYLDGKFDDACWQGLQPLTLQNASEETAKEYPTQAWFAHDRDFLYIALRCKHPAGQQVPPVKGRQRDSDLSAHDRVSILLDLDRDYSTCYHLQVDQRGCVFEECWGDRTWDPRWFVAVKSEADSWQIEAAIPLRELTGEPITHGLVWACNVVRVLPGRGVQGWSLPAGVEPRPEGMGLLFFRPAQQ